MQRAAESDLRGEDSVRVWQEARRLAPRSAVIGVNTALALERAGRKSDAERVLIETERMNRLWLPRWSLASFYLRQQRPEDAARWARLALERSNAGVRPALFGLLAQVGVPTTEWLSWCGGSPEMVAGALEYFGEAGKPAELADATRLLAALGPGRSPAFWRDSLKGACSRLILAGNGAAAVEAWNSMIARNALPYDLIGPSNLIGNPGFAEPVDGEAFNWKYHPLHGVSRILDSRTRTLRLRFDGSQPEASELLATEVWLEPRRKHRFSCSYRAEGIESSRTGPVWSLGGASSSPLEAGQGSHSLQWRTSFLEIPASPAGSVSLLVLVLNRQPGFTRAAGEVELREPKLEVVR